jgi:hypothetical protein
MSKKPSKPAAPAASQTHRVREGEGTEITYSKLKKSGKWGIRSNVPLKEGQQVTVMLKSGETKTETVEKVVFANESEGVWIAAIRESRQAAKPASDDEDPGDDDYDNSGADDDLPY